MDLRQGPVLMAAIGCLLAGAARADAAADPGDAAAAKRRRNDRGDWVDPVTAAPAGTRYQTCPSQTVKGEYSYLVSLPPDYEKNTAKKYPVIYWLHGGGGSQRTGEYFVENYVQAMKAGLAPEAILILVNGVGGSLFCDSLDGKKPVESVIVNDLIPHVDATYRTFGTRAMRAVEGFSMGGFGALHLACKFPEKFGSMTALSHAPIRPNSGWPKVDAVYREGPFAGNLDYFNANDPFQLVERNVAAIKDGTALRFIVGDKDQPQTQARTKEFFEKTQKLGMKSTLTIVPGVAHSCPKLYEVLGGPVFAYYTEYFASAAAREDSAPPNAPRAERKKKAKAATGASDGQGKRPRQFAWVDPDTTTPPGTQYQVCHSNTIKGDVSYLIYLPPDYAKQTERRYPVIYWLHGSGANQRKGGGMTQRLDLAIREGKAQPMIVVLVNGLAGETMYCDTRDGRWPLDSVIVKDLVPHIDATYRTLARREARGVEGFSMGGFGAAHFGFKYPEVFGVVSILAPALLGPDLPGETLQRKWSELFTSALGNDLDYFKANNPFDLVVQNAARLRGRSFIRIVPHDTPENWLIPRCAALHALLDRQGIAHEFDPRPDVKVHNYGALYQALGERGIGFFANAFPKSNENNPNHGR